MFTENNVFLSLKKIAFVIIATLVSVCLIVPSAYAAGPGAGSNENTTNGNDEGKGYFLIWKNTKSTNTWDVSKAQNVEFKTGNFIKMELKGRDQSKSPKNLNTSVYGKDAYWMIYLTCQKGKKWVNKFKPGWISSTAGNYANKVGGSDNAHAFFKSNFVKKTLKDSQGKTISYTGSGKIANIKKKNGSTSQATAVWINNSALPKIVIEKERKTKIVYYPGDPKNPPIDYRTSTPKDVYLKAPTSGNYYGITDPNKLKQNITIKIKTRTVEKITTYKEYPDGTIKDKKVKYVYVSKSTKTYEEKVKYVGTPAPNTQEKYAPFNLNRNDYAKTGDGGITSDYVNGEKLSGNVNNNVGITDNKDIESLDINNDQNFSFNFTNNVLGMPTRYDWFTKPTPLKEGTYEWVTGGTYANGRTGDKTNVTDGAAGYYRYDLGFYASINTRNDKTASLVRNSEEKIDQDQFSFMARDNVNYGGDWCARFVYSGNFTTDNEATDGSKFPEWWVNVYKQSRFYEYGVEFEGTFDTKGINEPKIILRNGGPSPVVSDTVNDVTTMTTNGLTEKGLYVGSSTSTFVQPVLYGHWYVKTLAGDVNGSGVNVR